MKKKVFSLMMTLLLAVTGIVRAQELTVHDGTTTNSYVPFYGLWVDDFTRSELVYPAAELSSMNGGDINSLSFYKSSSSTSSWGAASFQVYLKEVTNTTLNDYIGMTGATVVYEGSIDAEGGERQVTINFTTPYHYNGGNLLVGIYQTVEGSYSSAYWYGESVTGASASGYNGSSAANATFNQRDFLPKTTFTYSGGGGGGGGTADVLTLSYNGDEVDNLHLGDLPGYVDANVSPNWQGPAWMEPKTVYLVNDNDTDYEISVLDFTPSDGLFIVETWDGEPFTIAAHDSVALGIKLYATPAVTGTLLERQFVAIYNGTRTAMVWPISADVYSPYCPDIFELALNVDPITTGWPFVNVPLVTLMDSDVDGLLHNDYTLPFPEIPEGYDAVYKLEFENDVVLNAAVTNGANGKVALYREDFNGEGGPMADNYYTGPQEGEGGGASGGAFQAMIGDETSTSTSTYFPFHTLWNYSMGENLYLASELNEAGVTTAPMTSLSWYVSSMTTTTPQNNISIWMANVNDTELTNTSHTTAGMTLVYTGNNVLPVAGQWNEFELNAGSFAWDGHSNILVLCVRNNGSYQGSISWQTHNPGFTAMTYAYSDTNGGYDVTTSPQTGMYTSATNRANIIMKGGSRATEYVATSSMSYGPEIIDAAVVAGRYYLVASSTDMDFEVTINAEDMPCPLVEGFAFGPTPADNEDEVEPASVTLRWNIPDYATGWRLIFGSTYYPDPNHPQTVMYPEDGSFTTELANSYTVRNLWNNTNYFWRVEFNNTNCPDGVSSPIWGFTTHLNIPQNLTAVDYTVFDDETIVLNWNAVVDRTYRYYNVYRDGELIGNTQVNNINNTTYTDGPLPYNMAGYTYCVTAVYDEGESAPCDPVTVKVSGYGQISGYVYEQDFDQPVPGATVTYSGVDEFGDPHDYSFVTNGYGFYTGTVYAGDYSGQASKTGYQPATEPLLPFVNPVNVAYDNETTPVNYMLDENFVPVCEVIAEYYPDSLDPNSPYVKVYWGCGLPSNSIVEDFETGDFSKFDWLLDGNYPWSVTTNNPYEGDYCMKSGGAGVASVVSNMTVTVNVPQDGEMSFFSKISSENNFDYGYFFIDGQQMGQYTGAGSWGERVFNITAGEHTFQWRYTKDSSVNSNDDCFYVDYITFYRQPAPQPTGNVFSFDNGLEGWTNIDADGDGHVWYHSSEAGNHSTAAIDSHSGTGHLMGESYCNSTNVALTPDDYLVSPQMYPITNNSLISFWACAQDESYAAEHFGVAISTTSNTNPSAFTTIQEWTLSAKGGGGKPSGLGRGNRAVAAGSWYNFTCDLSAYAGQQAWIAIRHFNCSDEFIICLDDVLIGEAGKGIAETRSLDHYRVYRTHCYNDGPYTEENTVLLATVWVPDTVYIDVEWADLEPGIYKWGVGTVYSGNRGVETESPIAWSEPTQVMPETATRDESFDFEDGQVPAGWTNDPTYPWTVVTNAPSHTGHCLRSGNSGMASTTSAIQCTVDYSTAGTVSFEGGCWGEGTSTIWDKCEFYIDGAQQFSNGALQSWNTYTFNVPAGSHTFKWSYTKDGSVNPTEDAFFIDNVSFAGGSGGGGGNNDDNYQAGGEPIQLERESVIIWSNCLDKDMFLSDVTVTVLLNSADSPEGATVSFRNYNDVEQQNYPMPSVTLDESGFYAFDSFRRGEYQVTVEHDGYYTITDSVSIWNPTDLRYVMTEILFGVENVYVSRTGWAMWDRTTTIPGQPGDNNLIDFETGDLSQYVFDNNVSSYPWAVTTENAYDGSYCMKSTNSGVASSTSAIEATYNFATDGTVSFAALCMGEGSSTAWDKCIFSIDGAQQFAYGAHVSGWNEYSYPVSAGSHTFRWEYTKDSSVNPTGDAMYVDNISFSTGRAEEETRHFEFFKVMCTSIDGVPIYNHNTVIPMCQLATNEPFMAPLVEGDHYLVKIAAVYSTGQSEWSEPVEWVYEPCDHWGPVDEVEAYTISEGNHIEWVFEHGYNPYGGGDTPTPEPGNDVTVILTAGDVWGDGSGYQMLLDADANAYGTTIPETGALSLNCSGNEAIYAEFEYKIPANADGNCSTQNMVMNNSVSITIPAGTYDWCITNPTPGDRIWIASANGNVGGRQDDYTFVAGNTYEFTVSMGGSNDQVNVVITGGAKSGKAPLVCGEVKDIANVTPGNYGYIVRPAFNTSNMIGQTFTMINESTLEFNIADIANYDERVFFLYNLMNDTRFDIAAGEGNGMFIVSGSNDLNASFVDFIEQNIHQFTNTDKQQAAEMAREYKNSLPLSFVNSLMMDMYIQSRENNMCEFADPFCTDNGMYEFPAGVNAGSGETGPDYDCLYTQPNPAWYYMRIGEPGSMDIHMYSTPEVDIDFCCWGPFDDPTSPCPYGLTEDKVVSCSYSTSWTEHCMIPANAQTGEYYILVITNYSNQPCNINFSMVAGTGSTDCGILPPTDIIGFLITLDGEYLDIVGPTVRDYTHVGEYGDHEYCVRPIYPGEMTLPDHNYGWSMGCPVCESTNGGEITCAPGEPIHGEYVYNDGYDYGALIWWGEQIPPIEPIDEWLYYDDGVYSDAIGTGGSTVYWASMFPANLLTPYIGTNLTKVAMYEDPTLNIQPVTVTIYLGGSNAPQTAVSTQTFNPTGTEGFHEVALNTPVAIDGTQNVWIVFSEYGTYPATGCVNTGDANGRWISTDGNSWEDVATYGLDYTWMIRGYVTNQAKNGVVENVAIENLKPAMPETVNAELGVAGVNAHKVANLSFMNNSRSEIVAYNVYRATEADGPYDLIAVVPAVAGETYYEWFDDEVLPGTYFYQVTAVYDNGCESEPAPAFDDPTDDFVGVFVTGIGENTANVNLYPNPTSGNVKIEATGMRHITVVSVIGQTVYDADVKGDELELNMAQFNAGVYVVRIVTESGISTQRVTVVR